MPRYMFFRYAILTLIRHAIIDAYACRPRYEGATLR